MLFFLLALSIHEDMYEEAVKLFYANLICPDMPEGTERIPNSHLLKTTIKFSLSTLSDTLRLPNGRNHVFLSVNDKLSAIFKIESEVSLKVLSSYTDGGKTSNATHFKPKFHVISRWFIGNFVPPGGHKDFLHPLRPCSCMPSLQTKNLMCATLAAS